jgi:hypothetical protein
MWDQVPNIIRSAGAGPLAFFALGVLALAYLILNLFKKDHVSVRVSVFLLVFVLIGSAPFIAYLITQGSPRSSTDKPEGGIPSGTARQNEVVGVNESSSSEPRAEVANAAEAVNTSSKTGRADDSRDQAIKERQTTSSPTVAARKQEIPEPSPPSKVKSDAISQESEQPKRAAPQKGATPALPPQQRASYWTKVFLRLSSNGQQDAGSITVMNGRAQLYLNVTEAAWIASGAMNGNRFQVTGSAWPTYRSTTCNGTFTDKYTIYLSCTGEYNFTDRIYRVREVNTDIR